jgi:hypothetical protein
MSLTTTSLSRAAGISTAVAGLIFVAVQINHPALDASTIGSTEVVLRNSAKAVMSALVLVGITGMYLRQVGQAGRLGLIGYLVLGAGYLAMFSVEVITAFVLPGLADIAPGYVNDVIAAGTGGTPAGDIGGMQAVFTVAGIGYMAGGLLFGIALFRARVLARWAAALLAVGNVSTLALSVLPESFNRPFAVPTGIALIGLGLSLWRDGRKPAERTATTSVRTEEPAVR